MLARREWLDAKGRRCWRDISLYEQGNGGLRLQMTDMGVDVADDWRDFDLENWFDIPPQPAMPGLIETLRQRCAVEPMPSWTELESILKAAGICYTQGFWV